MYVFSLTGLLVFCTSCSLVFQGDEIPQDDATDTSASGSGTGSDSGSGSSGVDDPLKIKACSDTLLAADNFESDVRGDQWIERKSTGTNLVLEGGLLRLDIEPVSNFSFGGFYSRESDLSIKDRRVFVEVKDLPDESFDHSIRLVLNDEPQSEQEFIFLIRNAQIGIYYKNSAGSSEDLHTEIYSLSVQPFIQIRESEDILYFEVGQDPDNMTLVYSHSLSNEQKNLVLNNQIRLMATAPDNNLIASDAMFDNFNTHPSCE